MFDFDKTGQMNKEAMDAMLKSYSSMTKGFQALASEASDFSKKAYEDGASAAEKMAGAKTLDKAFEIQADYTKASYDTFVARATKMGDIYSDMAKEAYKPYEAVASKSA